MSERLSDESPSGYSDSKVTERLRAAIIEAVDPMREGENAYRPEGVAIVVLALPQMQAIFAKLAAYDRLLNGGPCAVCGDLWLDNPCTWCGAEHGQGRVPGLIEKLDRLIYVDRDEAYEICRAIIAEARRMVEP